MTNFKLTFVGAGSAFNIRDYQSNVLVENIDTGKRLLIDCGNYAQIALNDLGYTYLDIDAVFVSHLHADHAGGLEWLGFCRKFDPRCNRPMLYISKFLKNAIWNNTLSGGMASLQGEDAAELSTYFNVKAIAKNGSFIWEDVEFKLVQTIHIMDGFNFVPSFGLMFTINGKKIFFTSDTQFAPEQMKDFYKLCDIIFHDCETYPFESGVHAHYNKLKCLDNDTKSKIWLYHYNPTELPSAVADGFLGFVQKGQVFQF